MMYERIARPLLFKMDPEFVHESAIRGLRLAEAVPLVRPVFSKLFGVNAPALRTNVSGLEFQNPVGIAAGFDKDFKVCSMLSALGFGFVEGGTVTPKPQEGNPRPRLFRVPESSAIINRMGFNNEGAQAAARRLRQEPKRNFVLGVNIGKNKLTPNEEAVKDYESAFETLYPFGDYFTVNVSSPNTPGLRDLQHEVGPILSALNRKNRERKPIFVKIAPDLGFAEAEKIAEACIQRGADGIIATNTTVSRDGVNLKEPIEGGLSGRPLLEKSTEMLRHIRRTFGKRLVLIGAGGVFSAEDAYRKIRAGASLVQIYTGFIYGGAPTASAINRGLIALLERDGFKNVGDAVGVDIK